MHYKRTLSFAIIFKIESSPNLKDIKFDVVAESDE